MTDEHPNVAVLKKVNPSNVAGSADAFAADVVWHYFNPRLPDLQGDYVGLTGLQTFFETMASQTDGTFKVTPISVTPVGDELLVMQTKNTMILEDERIETDVVVVWRIVDGRIAEVWDIPSVYSARTSEA